MALDSGEIEKRMTYHAPTPAGVERHRRLSEAFAAAMAVVESLEALAHRLFHEALMAVVEEVVPDGREKSLAITKIEEAKMWSSAGVARNPATV